MFMLCASTVCSNLYVHCRPGPHTLNLPMPRSGRGGGVARIGFWGISICDESDPSETTLPSWISTRFHQIPPPHPSPLIRMEEGVGGGGSPFFLFFRSPLGTFLTRWTRRISGEVDIYVDVGWEGDGGSAWRSVRVNVRYRGGGAVPTPSTKGRNYPPLSPLWKKVWFRVWAGPGGHMTYGMNNVFLDDTPWRHWSLCPNPGPLWGTCRGKPSGSGWWPNLTRTDLSQKCNVYLGFTYEVPNTLSRHKVSLSKMVRDTTSKGRIAQGMHCPRDALSGGRNIRDFLFEDSTRSGTK